jgi:hypothetical protein
MTKEKETEGEGWLQSTAEFYGWIILLQLFFSFLQLKNCFLFISTRYTEMKQRQGYRNMPYWSYLFVDSSPTGVLSNWKSTHPNDVIIVNNRFEGIWKEAVAE